TDTFWLGDPDREETLLRARAYAEAGADGVFVPGIVDDADIPAVLDTAGVPPNVLFIPGKTEYPRMRRLRLHRPSTGPPLFRRALQATVAVAAAVTGDGVDRSVPSYGDVQRLVRR